MTWSPEQRDRALHHASDIRLARADLKRRIARGEITVASVLLDPPREARNWAVRDLLSAQRSWGRVRTMKVLSRVSVPEVKQVGGLTERQRRGLVGALGQSTAAGEQATC